MTLPIWQREIHDWLTQCAECLRDGHQYVPLTTAMQAVNQAVDMQRRESSTEEDAVKETSKGSVRTGAQNGLGSDV